MARQRSRERAGTTAPTDTTQPTQRMVPRMAIELTEISDDQVSALLAGSKQRGEYDRGLKQYMESGLKAAQIPLDSGAFQGKKTGSVKTGFENARKREGAPEGSDNVRVVVNEEQVYLIRTDLVS